MSNYALFSAGDWAPNPALMLSKLLASMKDVLIAFRIRVNLRASILDEEHTSGL